NTAPTRLWPMVESDAAYVSGCPPCGRARFRLDMAVHSSRYAQRSRMTPSRGGPSQKVIPYGASARTSRSIWTKSVLLRCNPLSVRHLFYDRTPTCHPSTDSISQRPASRCSPFIHAIEGHHLSSALAGDL